MRGESQCFADVAGEHVGALDRGERLVVSGGDSLFDEAFFQADAQFAGGDLDEVLRFERGEAAKSLLEQGLLCGGAALAGEGSRRLWPFPSKVTERWRRRNRRSFARISSAPAPRSPWWRSAGAICC